MFGLDPGAGGPADVGGRLHGASPWGAEDLAGNVWEWTMTLWQEDDTRRVLRGGSWVLESRRLSCSVRNWDHPWYRRVSVGFRLCFAPPQV